MNMKKIVIYSLLYQLLFSIFSLLLILIKEKFGSEIFAYALYSNMLYFFINLLVNILLIRYIGIHKIVVFILINVIFFNIYTYFTGDKKILFLELFKIKSDAWNISLSYHLSIFLSAIIVYFLFKRKA